MLFLKSGLFFPADAPEIRGSASPDFLRHQSVDKHTRQPMADGMRKYASVRRHAADAAVIQKPA